MLDVFVWDKPLRGFFRWPRAAPFVTWSRLRRRKTPRQRVEKGDETMRFDDWWFPRNVSDHIDDMKEKIMIEDWGWMIQGWWFKVDDWGLIDDVLSFLWRSDEPPFTWLYFLPPFAPCDFDGMVQSLYGRGCEYPSWDFHGGVTRLFERKRYDAQSSGQSTDDVMITQLGVWCVAYPTYPRL